MEALWRNAYRVDRATARRWAEGTDLQQTRAMVAEGRVLSLIKILPYEVLVGGRPVAMGGIGGVATWADMQGRGLAGRLIASSVPEMRRLGYAVSFLYPFAHRWYGRFGWETAGRGLIYSGFGPGDLPVSREGVRVRAALTDADLAQLRQVYDRLAPRYNGMVRRGERSWEPVLAASRDERAQLYLIDPPDGGASPAGYFLATDHPVTGGYETVIREFLCADAAAYRALFGFLSTLPTNVRTIRLMTPDRPALWSFFREPTVATSASPTFQCRVVDVAAACRARGWEEGAAGEVVFAVTDDLAPWNSATWRLRVEGGQAEIDTTTAAPEITMTIQQFSALYVGYCDPVDWCGLGLLGGESADAARRLRTLFCDRPTALLDLF